MILPSNFYKAIQKWSLDTKICLIKNVTSNFLNVTFLVEEISWWGAGREFPNHPSYVSDFKEGEKQPL